MSGYTDCACVTCFNVTVSADVAEPEMCAECVECGCEPNTYNGYHYGECGDPECC